MRHVLPPSVDSLTSFPVHAQAGVISNTKGDGEQLIGAPAIDPKVFFKAQAIMKKLPDMYRELGVLRKEIEELKKAKTENQ